MNRSRTGALLALLALLATSPSTAAGPEVGVYVRQGAKVAGISLEGGHYKVSWTQNGDEAQVRFAKDGKMVAETKAKVVTRQSRSVYDAVVLRENGTGGPVVAEVVMRGKSEALVLSQP